MARDELKFLYNKIKENKVEINSFSDIFDFNKIINSFNNIENEDYPDGIVLIDNTVYILEHFEVSIYRQNGDKDKLKEVINSDYKKKYEKGYISINEIIYLLPNVENLKLSLSKSLEKHMKQYGKYIEKAKKRFPDKIYKFFIVIEDESNAKIDNNKFNNIRLLDIRECVEELIKYDKIDGVISYNTSNIGDVVIAKDRLSMINQLDNLQPIQSCKLRFSNDSAFISKCDEIMKLIANIISKANYEEEFDVKEGIKIFKEER